MEFIAAVSQRFTPFCDNFSPWQLLPGRILAGFGFEGIWDLDLGRFSAEAADGTMKRRLVNKAAFWQVYVVTGASQQFKRARLAQTRISRQGFLGSMVWYWRTGRDRNRPDSGRYFGPARVLMQEVGH